ncbi:MAG: DUF2577 domain-containing protein [Anaerotignum sp.]|nr:DUF2577 domain-containing protein [Anaerotignum sp.]
MLDIIKQLALDVSEAGADFCMGVVTVEDPLCIRLEEGLELTEEFLVLTEDTLEWEETGRIRTWVNSEGGEWSYYRMIRDRRLRTGEAVAMLRAADGQQYLVLGRVRKGE